jgi:hypothetical protein
LVFGEVRALWRHFSRGCYFLWTSVTRGEGFTKKPDRSDARVKSVTELSPPELAKSRNINNIHAQWLIELNLNELFIAPNKYYSYSHKLTCSVQQKPGIYVIAYSNLFLLLLTYWSYVFITYIVHIGNQSNSSNDNKSNNDSLIGTMIIILIRITIRIVTIVTIIIIIMKWLNNSNRELETSTAPTKAKSREPDNSQALIQNKIYRHGVKIQSQAGTRLRWQYNILNAVCELVKQQLR